MRRWGSVTQLRPITALASFSSDSLHRENGCLVSHLPEGGSTRHEVQNDRGVPPDDVQTGMLFTVGWLAVLMLLVVTGFETDLGLIGRLGRAATLVVRFQITVRLGERTRRCSKRGHVIGTIYL